MKTGTTDVCGVCARTQDKREEIYGENFALIYINKEGPICDCHTIFRVRRDLRTGQKRTRVIRTRVSVTVNVHDEFREKLTMFAKREHPREFTR